MQLLMLLLRGALLLPLSSLSLLLRRRSDTLLALGPRVRLQRLQRRRRQWRLSQRPWAARVRQKRRR